LGIEFLGKEIKLAHFSVREYLLSDRIRGSSASGFGVTSVKAGQFISKSCLIYILHYDKSDSRTTSFDDLEGFPLLRYACEFWYIHAKSIPVESRKPVDLVASKLCLSDTALVAWLQVHLPDRLDYKPFSSRGRIGLPVYYASCVGLETVVRLLLDHNADVDAKNEDGQTALYAAAKEGHEAVM
jgi:hypothetical protein